MAMYRGDTNASFRRRAHLEKGLIRKYESREKEGGLAHIRVRIQTQDM